MDVPPDQSHDILSRLRGLVLLGGTVRPGGLGFACGRPILELPVVAGRSMLDLWCEQASQLANFVGRRLLVRVLIDKSVQPPKSANDYPQIELVLHHDPFELRGTGGIIKDATSDMHDDDYFFSAAANQIVCQPLTRIAQELAELGGDVGVIAHEEGQPSNITLIRRGCLSGIPDIGFMDLKEQAMPAIARNHRVKVKFFADAIGLPVRALRDYIDGVRWFHRAQRHDAARHTEPFAEDCVSTFSIIENGATLHTSAQALDSVVLAGAKIGRNASVVRSLICPGAVVPDGVTVLDQVISADTPARSFRKTAGAGV